MRFANILNREDALNHLFRVAGGLESQIIGDFEIIGQIKKAYNRFKKEKKNSNPYLERAINSAIQISKKIKNETGISNGAASVSYAAVYYILSHQKNISDKNSPLTWSRRNWAKYSRKPNETHLSAKI